METSELGVEMKPPLRTWLFNPFHYLAGGAALAVGLGAIVATGLLGALSNSHHDGVLDFHTGLPAAWWVFPCEGLINWLSLSLALLLIGWLVSRSRFRVVDVAGTQALARWPALLMALVALLPGFQRVAQQLPALARTGSMPNGLNPGDMALFTGGSFVIVVAIVWMVLLMYRGYAVSCNVRGARGIVSFIVALLLAEVASKAAVIGLLMASGHATPDALTPKPQAMGGNSALVGTWHAVEFAKDLEGTPSGISDLWLRELEFREDGTLVVLLGDNKRIDSLHLWHDSAIEWHGRNPSHRDHRTQEVTLKGGRLFLPWMPEGRIVGYYVFERSGGPSQGPAAKAEQAHSTSRAPAAPSKDDASLAGVWRATGLVADVSGTPIAGQEPELRELALAADGSVTLTFADGKRAAYVHGWGPGSRFEWYANLPQSPMHRVEELAVKNGDLHLPWRTFAGFRETSKLKGYHVFEKSSGAAPALPAPSVEKAEDVVGSWRIADLHEHRTGRSVDRDAIDLAGIAFASDGSAAVTYRDGRRVTDLHRWDNQGSLDGRFIWNANDRTLPGSVTEGMVLRGGFLFMPWRPVPTDGSKPTQRGCYVFRKASDAPPGPFQGVRGRTAQSPRHASRRETPPQASRRQTPPVRQPQQPSVPPPPLVGVWRAVKFAKDLSGADSGIKKLWLREIEFRQDGALNVALGNGKVIRDVHRWRGMQIEWYGNAASHPDRKNVLISFQGAQLFFPWAPTGKVEGYYVFEKPGYVPAVVHQPAAQPPPRQKVDLSDEQKERAAKLKELQVDIQVALKIDSLRRARTLCEEALALCGDDPAFDEHAAWAEGALTWIHLTENPSARFAITGTLGTGDRCTLLVSDARDGVEFRGKPGGEFDDYRLDSIDHEAKTAEISAKGESYTIASR